MITKRVQDKLTGRDFENEADALDIDSQVRRFAFAIVAPVVTAGLQVARLISEAISEANLSQVRLVIFAFAADIWFLERLTFLLAVLHRMVSVLVIRLGINGSKFLQLGCMVVICCCEMDD